MGDLIVLAVLGIIIALVIRSIWKNQKEGKHCGCSGSCEGCCSHCKTNQKK